MKLLITGNGFDLASGLKTGYQNFFDDLLKKKAKQFSTIETILGKDYVIEEKTNNGTQKQNFPSFSTIQSQRDAADRIYKQIKKEIQTNVKDVTIWDIYFSRFSP